jgi:SWI/SNF-related matrix-associated actin-dependent regulator of chromatin subfamily A member 5
LCIGAHRIGQKKPVQVFRLVTDDTVEVKVVERAQQKLKLDAMVVQQGRLQDKEKKMSRQDLLDTLRFGADKVFRSKESAITDADIDLILEEGRKRTEEMSEKLKVNDKGDMYDFRLDGGIATQMFEGKDYSDRSMREAEKDAMLGAFFIDTGKRERKAIGYAETGAKAAETLEDRKLKMPRHLRLPKMEDYQFFDRARLTELSEEETRMFDQMAERGEVSAGQISKLVCLPAELHNEKQKLISDAFGDWTRVHYNSFVRASAKHGRRAYDKIAKDVGRPVDDVQRYCETFWSKGPAMLPSAEFDRVVKMVEKV